MQTETHIFFIERTIEVEIKIIINKEQEKYFAYVFDDMSQEALKSECWIEDDGQLMTEPVSSDEEYDCVIEAFCSYIKENGVKYARKCTCCGKGMNEGYFANYEYFCTDECLHTEYPPYTWLKFTEEDEDNHYWTEWETEEDFDYVLFDNKLITI
jgi:hypothetical protein